MLRILIANSKGGCGKTTVTTTLAGYFARQGCKVVLYDSDPQGSSSAWCAQRSAQLAPVQALASNDPSHGLAPGWLLRIPTDADVLLFDTPAGLRAHEFEQFARHADALVIPMVPSPIDVRASLAFIDRVRRMDVVRNGRLRVALIANRLRTRTVAARQLDVTLERLTAAALARVRDAQVYVGMADLGQSIFDATGKMVEGHQQDWTALLEWLERRRQECASRATVTQLATPLTLRGG